MASRKGMPVWPVAIVIVLAALAGGYSYAWHRLADRLESEASASLEALNKGAVRAECDDAHVRGYPLELGLSCTGFTYEDGARGISVKSGAFQSAAGVFAPRDIAGSVEGPALVTVPQAPPLRIDWQAMNAETRLAAPLPERVAISGKAVTASLADGATPLVRMATAYLRAEPAGPAGRDLEMALNFDRLALGEGLRRGLDLPPLDGEARFTLADGVALIADPPESLRGMAADLKTVALSSGDAGLTLAGPVAVGPDGLVSADLTVTVRRPREVSALLAEIFPDTRREIETAFSGLAMFGNRPTVPLKIVEGRAFIGFIPIGKLPPLE